jgi:hypothetical protein
MKHLEDEDIARLIDGNAGKDELEHIWKHLSECDSCLAVYSETVKALEDMPASFHEQELIRLKVHPGGRRRPYAKWLPYAASIIIFIIAAFIYMEISNGNIKKAKIQHLQDSYAETGARTFVSPNDQAYAAVRVGIFIEDMSLLVDVSPEDPLKTKITRLMNSQLELFDIDPDTAGIDRIRQSMEGHKLSRLFRFGCFVERTFLSTFENKSPPTTDIDTYRQVARSFDLPIGVLKSLDKMSPGASAQEIRDACKNIKDIFLSME